VLEEHDFEHAETSSTARCPRRSEWTVKAGTIIFLSVLGAGAEFCGILIVSRRFSQVRDKTRAILERVRHAGARRQRIVRLGVVTERDSVGSVLAVSRHPDPQRLRDDLEKLIFQVWNRTNERIAAVEDAVRDSNEALEEVERGLKAMIEEDAKAPWMGVVLLLVGLAAFVTANIVGAVA